MREPRGGRLLFVDNLRTLLVTLVILLHAAITYGAPGGWYYKESRPDELTLILLTPFVAVTQAFFMGLFFLIAGYFTPGSLDRKGTGRFLRDRLLRLGVPLLVYDYVLHPLTLYPLAVRLEGSEDSPWQLLARDLGTFRMGQGPLWFVEALLVFTLAYVLWRCLARSPAPPPSRGDGRMPGNGVIALFALSLGAISFAVRTGFPIGWVLDPLNLQIAFFPQYIALFAIGIIAYRRRWLSRISDAMGRSWLVSAAVLIAVAFPILFVAGRALDGDLSPFMGAFTGRPSPMPSGSSRSAWG